MNCNTSHHSNCRSYIKKMNEGIKKRAVCPLSCRKRPLWRRRPDRDKLICCVYGSIARLLGRSCLGWLLSSVTTRERWRWRPGAGRLWWPWWWPWLLLSAMPPTPQPISSSAFNVAILSPSVINISSLFTALGGNYTSDAAKKWGLDAKLLGILAWFEAKRGGVGGKGHGLSFFYTFSQS